jgi:proteasome accessory factor B
MDKLERLLTLTATLLDTRRPLTADELRERVGGYPENRTAFRRAFERDKDDLREMGVPISVEPVPGREVPVDGYRIHAADYQLPDPGLEPDELAALNLAAAVVRLDGAAGPEALWKLGGTVAPPADDGTPGATASPGQLAALPREPALLPLFSAVVDRRPATFRYRGAERTSVRTVEPHRLDYRKGRWYLAAFDPEADGERLFRLDRIDGELALGPEGAFEPPASPAPAAPSRPWELGEGEAVTARLLVDARQVVWASQHLGHDALVEERPDGSAVFEVAVTRWPAFRSFVLGFLDHAEVLGPPELRADLVAWLRQVADPGTGTAA